MKNYVACLIDLERLEEAEAILDGALELGSSTMPPYYWGFIELRLHRGRLLVAQGKHEDARIELSSVLEVSAEHLRDEHPTTLRIAHSLSLAEFALQLPAAVDRMERVVAAARSRLGAMHWRTAVYEADLARMQLERDPGAAPVAINRMRWSHDLLCQVFSVDHPQARRIAMMLEEVGAFPAGG